MVGQTVKSQTYSRIEIKIYSTMFLYSKEGWVITFGSRLLETQSDHNKR